MRSEIFTFCDYAQENGGKLTIVGTFDTIIAPKYPCLHAQLSVVIRIRFDLWEFGQHDFRIETRSMNHMVDIQPITGKIMVRNSGNESAVTHLVFGLNNLRFLEPGVLNWTLFIDDKEVITVPLYVRQMER